MTETVLLAGARTPTGKLTGVLSALGDVDLGAHAICAPSARQASMHRSRRSQHG